MSGFASFDEIIDAACNLDQRYNRMFVKRRTAAATHRAGTLSSYWLTDGTSGVGAAPAAAGTGTGSRGGTSYTNAAGSIYFPDQSGKQKHIQTFDGTISDQGATVGVPYSLLLYDRLTATGPITIASTGNKDVYGPATLPRYSTRADEVECWIEVTTVSAATATISLASYTNEGGTSGRVGGTFVAAASTLDVGRMYRLPLQSGDFGVTSVEQINVAVAGSASSVVNIVLLKPIWQMPVFINEWNSADFITQYPIMPRLYDGASLSFACIDSVVGTSITRSVFGMLRVVYR